MRILKNTSHNHWGNQKINSISVIRVFSNLLILPMNSNNNKSDIIQI